MPVKIRITLLFTLLVVGILCLVCGSVYYFTYTNRIKDIQTRLTNRAITTGRLLSQSGLLDQAFIRKVDASTAVAMREKVVQVYDLTNKRVYWSTDYSTDTLSVDRSILDRARKEGKSPVYFAQDGRDVIAYPYQDEKSSFVIVAAAYDETGNEKMHHLQLVLSLSFIGGVLSALIGGYLFSISLLYPLRRIADEAGEISARNLTRRIRSTGTGSKDEWHYLTDTLNRLLDRLQESFEIQGRFIANASHELSTPLTSISSQLEVSLQRVRTVEEYRKVIQSVYQDTRQLGRLTQTLLEFARASGTASGLEIDLIRIDEILLRLPGEIPRMNALYAVTLDFAQMPEAEESLLVFGNAELLFTAIRNIVINACKYSDDHHATVRLAVEEREIRIEVEDKGRGIAREEWENIFQPFYRTEDGHGISGHGLGLSLSKRILQLHKGSIRVESELGKGSIFFIRLPMAEAAL